MGSATFDYATKEHPWGRRLDAILLKYPKPKFRKTCGRNENIFDFRKRLDEAYKQQDKARAFILSMKATSKNGYYLAVCNSLVHPTESTDEATT
jgi:hypothetical protein